MKIKVKNSFTWNKSNKKKELFKMAYSFEGNQIIICLHLVIFKKPRQ